MTKTLHCTTEQKNFPECNEKKSFSDCTGKGKNLGECNGGKSGSEIIPGLFSGEKSKFMTEPEF
jgi:hypothetical protein